MPPAPKGNLLLGLTALLVALPATLALLSVGPADVLRPSADASEAATFSSPVRVANVFGFEPSVRVADDGTIYVAIARALPNPSWIYRSTDDGATWSRCPIVPVPLLGAEPEIALAQDGTLYFTDLWVGNSVVAWYPAGCATLGGWTVVGQGSTVVDRQWITMGEASPLGGHEMWLNTNDIGRGLYQYYSPDAKRAPAARPFPLTTSPHRSDPPVYDPVHGITYTVYDQGSSLTVARSTADGLLPSRGLVAQDIGRVALFVVTAVDEAGNVYVTWSAEKAGVFHVYLAWSTDQGVTWSAPVAVSGASGTHVFPWVAGGSAGKAVVAWLGSDVTDHVERMPAAAEWQVRLAQFDLATQSVATSTATGTMHRGSICISGLSCDTGSGVDRDLGDYIQVAVGPDGYAHVAYTDDHAQTSPRIYHVRQTGGSPN